MNNRITIITGPTASGKSSLAYEVAQKNSAQIISMDSMQIYKQMDIGTAKPSKKLLQNIRHHLIDIIDPDEKYSVARYIDDVSSLIETNPEQNFLIVGGTGLYLNALLDGLSFPIAAPDPEIRSELQSRIANEGSDKLWQELKDIDPQAAAKITRNDAYRIVRALEVFQKTGQPISSLQKKDQSIIPDRKVICLDMPREDLYQKIEQRVDDMINKGLIEEVKSLLNSGYDPKIPALQAIGYKEIIAFLNKEMTLDEAVELIKKNTRNFAKRQYTWFRRFEEIEWIDAKI